MSSYLSAHETIAAIRSGKTTAAELATEALERIQSVDQSGYELALELGGRARANNRKRSRNLLWATQTLDNALKDVDVLIGATYSPAWESTLGKGDDYGNNSWITMAPAIAGYPIGCIPMGITEGLPVGLGIVARANDEVRLVTAMAQIESALGFGVLQPTFTK